jgi:hypothetical protein
MTEQRAAAIAAARRRNRGGERSRFELPPELGLVLSRELTMSLTSG